MTVRSRRTVWTARGVLLMATGLVIVPLIYMVGISFKPADAVFENVLLPFAGTPTVENYAPCWRRCPY